MVLRYILKFFATAAWGVIPGTLNAGQTSEPASKEQNQEAVLVCAFRDVTKGTADSLPGRLTLSLGPPAQGKPAPVV